MLEFIKRNKMFSGCFVFSALMIILLSTLVFIKDINGDNDVIVIPPIIHEEDEIKDPEITLFSGSFDDDSNSIHLTWDYQINNHTFQKVEIYKDEKLIKTLYSDRSYDISIFNNDISTGDNNFELQLYYDNGIIVAKEIKVFVDYVFDLQASFQLMNNNLGKGYLVTFSYSYNTITPVGVPIKNATKIATASKTPMYWSWKYINWESNLLKGDYQTTKVYYFISLDSIPNQEITWELDIKLDSVGVRFEDTFTENPNTVTPITVDIKLK